MVTLAVRRVVWMLCACVVAASCSRKSAAPAVNDEPGRAPIAESARTPPAPAPRAFAEKPSNQQESALGAWPSARDADQRQKSAGSAEYDNFLPGPERRPGLATQYGESRDSSITYVRFERADGDHPSAMLSLFYDDESGVEAKTGRDADDATPGVFPVRGGAVEVSIVSSWDNPLPYLYGNGRTFIVGDASDRYVIRLRNHTGERYEIVASVDGLDVISGNEATLAHHGYILAPWSTLRIEAFRDTMDSVRAFRFGEPSESYAVGRGFGRDIGVIGVALFGERSYRDGPRQPNPFPGRFAAPPSY